MSGFSRVLQRLVGGEGEGVAQRGRLRRLELSFELARKHLRTSGSCDFEELALLVSGEVGVDFRKAKEYLRILVARKHLTFDNAGFVSLPKKGETS